MFPDELVRGDRSDTAYERYGVVSQQYAKVCELLRRQRGGGEEVGEEGGGEGLFRA